MDWSLVLASQGIDTDLGEDQFGYFLLVDEEDYGAARSALRAYRRENPREWRAEFAPDIRLRFHFGAAVWGLFLVFIYWLQSAAPGLEQAWVMNERRFAAGEWWRALTAIGLHADIAHLASNLTFGLVFLTLAMEAYGVVAAPAISLFAAGLANVTGWFVYSPEGSSLGASGMVMAALGMLGAYSAFWRWQRSARWSGAIRGSVAAALMLAFIGLDPRSDMVAHVAGFVFGFAGGWILLAVRRGRGGMARPRRS